MSLLGEYTGVALFYGVILLLVYLNRNRFEKYASFMYLYKTKFGISFMKKVSKRFGRPIRFFGYFGVVLAYIGFFFVSYLLLQAAYDLIIDKPGALGGSPVIPGLPIAGLGITFPLIIGWISLFIIMIVHEFSHGIMSKAHGVKIKSSGIAFFGPILGAFVEPDEAELAKKPHKVQHSIFAAGPVSNILLWIVCLLLLVPLVAAIVSMTAVNGVSIGIIQNDTLPAFSSGMSENSVIIGIENHTITDIASLEDALDSVSPGQEIAIMTKNGSYMMMAAQHPDNQSRAYIGIWIYGEHRTLKNNSDLNRTLHYILNWIYELLSWTAFISVNIGLINLFPIFITDGARILKLNFEHFIKDKKRALEYWTTVNLLAVFVIFVLLLLPLLRSLVSAAFGFFTSF